MKFPRLLWKWGFMNHRMVFSLLRLKLLPAHCPWLKIRYGLNEETKIYASRAVGDPRSYCTCTAVELTDHRSLCNFRLAGLLACQRRWNHSGYMERRFDIRIWPLLKLTGPWFHVYCSLSNVTPSSPSFSLSLSEQCGNTFRLYCILLYIEFCEWVLLGNWSAVKHSNMVLVLRMIKD